ncbi:MAG TPA: hypothetical protein VFC28_06410 [Opitutaceae bacterium]|nr:hypothetical protein [Opitutaceae bacterium]
MPGFTLRALSLWFVVMAVVGWRNCCAAPFGHPRILSAVTFGESIILYAQK